MSLESIIERILEEAEKKKQEILEEARLQAAGVIQEAKKEAERISRLELMDAGSRFNKEGQKLIVNARLEKKKSLLLKKRKIMEGVFMQLKSGLANAGLKKQEVTQDKVHSVPEDLDFYLTGIASDYESEVSRMIFG